MKKIFLSLLFLFSFVFANTTVDEALKLAKKQNKDVMVFLYSDYCYYCESMYEDTIKDKEIQKYLAKRFIFLKVHQRDEKRLIKGIKTDFVPAIYIISAEDKEILLELPGRKDKKTFLSIVKDTLLE